MGLVEPLCRGDDVDSQAIAEALRHRGGIVARGIGAEVHQRGRSFQVARCDAHHGARNGYAGIGKLDAAVGVEPHLKSLPGCQAVLRVFRHVHPAHHHAAGIGEHAHAAGGLRGIEIVEQRRDTRRAGGGASQGTVGGSEVARRKREVAIGIDVHLVIRHAEKREGERQAHQAGVVVIERGQRRALSGRGGIVALRRDGIAVPDGAGRRGCERQRVVVEVELIHPFHHAAGVFDDGDVADVAVRRGRRCRGGRQRPEQPRAARPHGLPMQEQRFLGSFPAGTANRGIVPRGTRRHETNKDQCGQPEAAHS